MENKYLEKIKKEISQKEKNIKQCRADKEMYMTLIKQLDTKISENSTQISELKQKLNTFETGGFISDHATLRYLERTGIIDIKQLKEMLLTDEVLSAIYMGADKITSNGYEFRIKNGKIVTIIKYDEN